MDHSAMDHSAMHGLESPTPSPAASAMHQGHMMSMQMWFQATEKVVLWFKEWKVSTHAECVLDFFSAKALIAEEQQ